MEEVLLWLTWYKDKAPSLISFYVYEMHVNIKQ